jgi:hypothetical protein
MTQVLFQNKTKIKLFIWHCLKTLFIFSITKSKKILTHQKCHQATLKASQAVLPDKDKKRINIPWPHSKQY